MRGWERRFFPAEAGFSRTSAYVGASAPITTVAAGGFRHRGLCELACPSQRGRAPVQPGRERVVGKVGKSTLAVAILRVLP